MSASKSHQTEGVSDAERRLLRDSVRELLSKRWPSEQAVERSGNAGAIAAHYNGFVLIRGHKAPVIGRLCMNVLMIDLTDISTAQNGDEVMVMGDYEGIRPYDIGVRTGSGNGRVVTSCINSKIPRIIG